MKRILYIVLAIVLLASCSESYEEKQRISRAERARLAREDSAALKIGVLPTMDCLPLYVAKERRLFDTLGVDIRLKPFNSQIDCDAALLKGQLEGTVTDLVKTEGMKKKGTPLRYATATQARWQFVANRLSRITEMKQLTDKMVAMARFSATHLLAELCVDSAHLKRDDVFLIQINDPNICLKMLQNNELDAMLLPEPQATSARIWKNPVLFDTENRDIRLGVIAFREKVLTGKERKRQKGKRDRFCRQRYGQEDLYPVRFADGGNGKSGAYGCGARPVLQRGPHGAGRLGHAGNPAPDGNAGDGF